MVWPDVNLLCYRSDATFTSVKIEAKRQSNNCRRPSSASIKSGFNYKTLVGVNHPGLFDFILVQIAVSCNLDVDVNTGTSYLTWAWRGCHNREVVFSEILSGDDDEFKRKQHENINISLRRVDLCCCTQTEHASSLPFSTLLKVLA